MEFAEFSLFRFREEAENLTDIKSLKELISKSMLLINVTKPVKQGILDMGIVAAR